METDVGVVDVGEADESGLNAADIDVVMSQANCSRAKGEQSVSCPHASRSCLVPRQPVVHYASREVISYRCVHISLSRPLRCTDDAFYSQAILDAN